MKIKEFNERLAEAYNAPKRQLRKAVIFGTALVLISAFAISIFVEWIMIETGILSKQALQESWVLSVLILCGVSIVIGGFLSWLAGKFILKPINQLMDGMAKLTAGAYNTRLDFGRISAMKPLSDGFNSLAQELENTEVLRSDFVNNFSHEFKTPVASIIGLIKLMETGRMSKEKQKEYLAIIKEEANRLSDMATNILNLTKVESQSILTGQTTYNLSEQLRICVLLLEKKWSDKKLDLTLDFEEYEICGNENMLKQVWFNLLDNAIKFSDDGGALEVCIDDAENNVAVSIINTGEEISEENKEKIFHKFYQADTTHKREGNGIGLSVVRHIVELHKGKIEIESKDGRTRFTVFLPR